MASYGSDPPEEWMQKIEESCAYKDSAKFVLIYLCRRAKHEDIDAGRDAQVWPSVDAIAAAYALKRRSVFYGLSELADIGAVSKVPKTKFTRLLHVWSRKPNYKSAARRTLVDKDSATRRTTRVQPDALCPMPDVENEGNAQSKRVQPDAPHGAARRTMIVQPDAPGTRIELKLNKNLPKSAAPRLTESSASRFKLKPASAAKMTVELFAHVNNRPPKPAWQMPADVRETFHRRFHEPPILHFRPRYPRIPADDSEHQRAAALLTAWQAVARRRTRKSYQGRVSAKRQGTLVTAADMLCSAGISPWWFFDWAWERELKRTKFAPKFFSVASPVYVGRTLDHCPRAPDRSLVLVAEAEQLHNLRCRAQDRLYADRPTNVDAALRIIDDIAPKKLYEDLVSRAKETVAKRKQRDEFSLRNGVWVW